MDEFHTKNQNQIVNKKSDNYDRNESCKKVGIFFRSILKGPVFLEKIYNDSANRERDCICEKVFQGIEAD